MIGEKSIGVVAFRDEGKKRFYLLLHYPAGYWDFIKGNIEPEESEKDTASREAKEEAGLKDLEFIPGFREGIQYFYKLEDKLIKKEVIFYLAETKQKEVKISYEHKGYNWLGYEEALKLLTFQNAKQILEKSERFLKQSERQKSLSSFTKKKK